MYNASDEIITCFQNLNRQVARIEFTNGTESLEITESNIVLGGLSIDRYSASGDCVEIGSAIAAELSLKLENYYGTFDNVSFDGGEMYVEVGVVDDDGNTLYMPMGYFIVTEHSRTLSTISLTALDRMILFDNLVSWDNFAFPITISEMIESLCELIGVECATDLTTLVNYSYSITSVPSVSSVTYRSLLQWIAFITGTCALFDHEGKLTFNWYSQTNVSITPSERYSSDMGETDVVVTGLTYTDMDGSAYAVGTSGCILSGGKNYLLQSDAPATVANTYSKIRGFSYRPYEAEVKPLPYMLPTDMILYTDSKSVVHETIITHLTFTLNCNTNIAGVGENTSSSYSSTSGSTNQQVQVFSETIKTTTLYFTIGDSADEPPSDPSETVVAALVGSAIVGTSQVEVVGWSTIRVTATESDEYIWVATLLTYVDGTTAWETPICLTDDRTILNQAVASAQSTAEEYTDSTITSLKQSISTTYATQDELAIVTDNIDDLRNLIEALTLRIEELESNQGKILFS